jgi:hypothetical protein
MALLLLQQRRLLAAAAAAVGVILTMVLGRHWQRRLLCW